MPYDASKPPKSLTDRIRAAHPGISEKGIRQFVHVFNSAKEGGADESSAFAQAYGVIKKGEGDEGGGEAPVAPSRVRQPSGAQAAAPQPVTAAPIPPAPPPATPVAVTPRVPPPTAAAAAPQMARAKKSTDPLEKGGLATAFDDLLRHQGLDVKPAPAPAAPVRQRLTPEQARAQLAALPKTPPEPTAAEVKAAASTLRVVRTAGGNVVLDTGLDAKIVKLLATNLPDVPERPGTGSWD